MEAKLLMELRSAFDSDKDQFVLDNLTDQVLFTERNPELYALKARSYLYLNKNRFGKAEADVLGKASALVKTALELDSKFWEAHFAHAKILDEQGKYAEALDSANLAVLYSSGKLQTYLIRGEINLHLSRYHDTIQDCITVTSNQDVSEGLLWMALNNIGVAYYELGRYLDAEFYYLEAERVNPEASFVHYNLAELKFLQNDKSESLKRYQRGININDENKSLGLNSKGIVHRYYNENAAAEKAFQESIVCNDKNLKAYINLAELLEEQSKYTEALKLLKKAETLGSEESFSIRQRLKLKMSAGKLDSADEIAFPRTSWDQVLNILLRNSALKELLPIARAYVNKVQPELTKIKEYCLKREHRASSANRKIAHYTSLKIADLIMMDESKNLRYSNEVFMNDPQEGKILIQCLEDFEFQSTKAAKPIKNESRIWKAFSQAEAIYEPNCYIGSFIPADNYHEDELVMWRTYGRDEHGHEARGCCLVFDEHLFDRWELSNISTDLEEQKFKRQYLYQVLYYDARKKKFDESELQNNIQSLSKELTGILTSAESSATKIKDDDVKNTFLQCVNEIIFHALSDIRYLFKSADYRFESEQRVMHYAPAHSKKLDHKRTEVHVDNYSSVLPRRLYIESTREVKQFLERIVIGPKVNNPERFQYLKAKAVIDCPKTAKPAEVFKSTCQYQ